MRKPIFPSKGTALLIGTVAFGVAWVALHDAYQGRGQDTPWYWRPVSWW